MFSGNSDVALKIFAHNKTPSECKGGFIISHTRYTYMPLNMSVSLVMEMGALMKNKICMVTGATAGIGYVTALELARLGA